MNRPLVSVTFALALLAIQPGAVRADSQLEGDSPSPAETAAVGSRLPALRFEDQHGESHSLDASLKLVVFTRDMDAGEIVKETLAENGGEVLAANGAVYISDVHGMPSLIRRMFALPSMRKRPYPMWLDIEGEDTKIFPASEGRPSLIYLEALTVTRIESPASGAALREALGMPAAPSAEAE